MGRGGEGKGRERCVRDHWLLSFGHMQRCLFFLVLRQSMLKWERIECAILAIVALLWYKSINVWNVRDGCQHI